MKQTKNIYYRQTFRQTEQNNKNYSFKIVIELKGSFRSCHEYTVSWHYMSWCMDIIIYVNYAFNFG